LGLVGNFKVNYWDFHAAGLNECLPLPPGLLAEESITAPDVHDARREAAAKAGRNARQVDADAFVVHAWKGKPLGQ